MIQVGTETEEKKLDRAVELIEQLESKVDIFTLNRAIAKILDERARTKLLWHDWICEKLVDAEREIPVDDIHPLMRDLA